MSESVTRAASISLVVDQFALHCAETFTKKNTQNLKTILHAIRILSSNIKNPYMSWFDL